jgi:hypothetical protein
MWEAWFEYPGKGLDRKSKSYRIIAETFYMVKTLQIGLRENLGLREIGGLKEAQEGGGFLHPRNSEKAAKGYQ